MILRPRQILMYILEAGTIALIARYILGTSSIDQSVVSLMIIIIISHVIFDSFEASESSQIGGMGLQTGLGVQRTLKGIGHMPGQNGGDGSQLGGMDDPVALDYYGNNFNLSAPVKDHKYGIYGSLTATTIDPRPSEQVNVLDRFIDDKMALEQSKKIVNVDVHESFVGNLLSDPVKRVEAFDPAASGSGSGVTAGERGLVYGTIDPIAPTATSISSAGREGRTLYSEDLIDIESDGKRLSLPNGSKSIAMMPKSNGGLFKLRFKLMEDNPNGKLMPIKYGQKVSLVYNDNVGNTITINHDGDLNILDNNRDIGLEIIKKTNPDDIEGHVNTLEPVVLRTSAKRYLTIKDNKRIQAVASLKDATVFTIVPARGCGPLWRYDHDNIQGSIKMEAQKTSLNSKSRDCRRGN